MPLVSLICPFCNESLEANVTSVTKTRQCPHCQKTIVVQFRGAAGAKTRRGAVFMQQTGIQPVGSPIVPGAAAPVVEAVKPVVADPPPLKEEESSKEPPALRFVKPRKIRTESSVPVVGQTSKSSESDDVQPKMRHDPEVGVNGRRLIVGTIIMFALIVLAVSAKHYGWWHGLELAYYQSAIERPSIRLRSQDPVRPSAEVIAALKTGAMHTVESDPAEVDSGVQTSAPVETVSQASKRAEEVAQNFLMSANVTERLKHVRDLQLWEPKIREYYLHHMDGPVPYQGLNLVSSSAEDEMMFEFNVLLRDGSARLLYVFRNETGSLQADWPSFVIYNEVEWRKLMETKPASPVLMRVLAQEDDYFNYSFTEGSGLGCIKLTNPRDPVAESIYAYFSRSSALGREMSFILRQASRRAVPLTLTVRFPERSSSGNQVWLDELVAEGWLARGR